MNIISYYQSIENLPFSDQSRDLIDLWEQTWLYHGWNPIILDEAWTHKNELYKHVSLNDQKSNFYLRQQTHMWKYHRCCYCRLLAYCEFVRQHGPTLYADYDVMNYGLKPISLNNIKLNSWLSPERSLVYLDITGAEEIESIIKTFNDSEIEIKDLPEHHSDMILIATNTHPVYNNTCFSNGRFFYTNNDEKLLYCSNMGDQGADFTPLVHYDNGLYTRQPNFKGLTRKQVIVNHGRFKFNA